MMFNFNKLNYANYTADKVIKIDKYISEEDTPLKELLNACKESKVSLLLAPTGSGKTYSIINLLKELKAKALFIVPNALQVEQIRVEYNIAGACGDFNVLAELSRCDVVALTWDKFIQLEEDIIKDYIIVLDEVHQTFIEMYRLPKINKLNDRIKHAKGQLHITATPDKLDFTIYDNIIEYEQRISTNYQVYLYDKICHKTVIEIVSEADKFALFRDNIKYLNKVHNETLRVTDVITSGARDFSQTYKNIVANSTINNIEGILNTRLLTAGVNVYDPRVTDIIIIGEKDIATIKQYVARFRGLSSVRVHIFNNYAELSRYEHIETSLASKTESIIKATDGLNAVFEEVALRINPIKLDDTFCYWDKEARCYKPEIVKARHEAYTEYYARADVETYSTLLEQYFSSIEIVQLEELPKKKKKAETNEKKEALEKLEQHKEILVGAVEILTDKVPSKIERYYMTQRRTIASIRGELMALEVPKLLLVDNVCKVVKAYTKYVLENGYNWELAWVVANLSGEGRKKFFNQLSGITYREIASLYPHLVAQNSREVKIYNLIIKEFPVDKEYTGDDLVDMKELLLAELDEELSSKEVGKKLNETYKIKEHKGKMSKLAQLNSEKPIENQVVSGANHHISKGAPTKWERRYTIENYLSLEDICEQYGLGDTSYKVLDCLLSERKKKLVSEAEEIDLLTKLFD